MSSAKRKPLPAKTPVERRIDHIIGKMLQMAWTAKEKRACVKRWGISQVAVEAAAAEASRYIRRSQEENREDVKERILAGIEDICATARQRGNLNAAIKAMDMLARAHGVYLPERLEVSGELASLSEEQLEAKRAAIIARIAAEPAKVKLQ